MLDNSFTITNMQSEISITYIISWNFKDVYITADRWQTDKRKSYTFFNYFENVKTENMYTQTCVS